LTARLLAGLAVLASALLLAACATGRAARHFTPPDAGETRETVEALAVAVRRAAELPASRLLYDARMGGGGAPAVPGTLAVTYDGEVVQRASLTGPFGSRVAEYDSGRVTGEDRRALVVDPASLRAVLAGVWPGEPVAVTGCDGADCLAVWDTPRRVTATVDRKEQRLDSLEIAAESGKLTVTYAGTTSPWPQRISAREDPSGRRLSLSLVAVESVSPARADGPP
jgi:hypothetical protein